MSRPKETKQEFFSAIYDDDSRRHKILRAYILAFCVVVVLEIAVGLIMDAAGMRAFDMDYALKFIILPTVVNAIVCLVTLLIIRSEKLKSDTKNNCLIAAIWLVTLVVAVVHSYFMVLYAAFVVPVFITIVFADKKQCMYAAGMGVAGTFLSAALAFIFDDTWSMYDHYLSAAVASAFIVISCAIAFLIIEFYGEREKELHQAHADNAKLAKQVRVDGLTGLKNHTAFYDDLEDSLQTARSRRIGFCVAMLDVDNFKRINDSYGHNKGDDILRFVSVTLADCMGRSGSVYRYGGDEFALIFLSPNAENAKTILEKIRTTIADEKHLFTDGSSMSISSGLYIVTELSMTAEQIFYRADQALYQAKFDGKNRCQVAQS